MQTKSVLLKTQQESKGERVLEGKGGHMLNVPTQKSKSVEACEHHRPALPPPPPTTWPMSMTSKSAGASASGGPGAWPSADASKELHCRCVSGQTASAAPPVPTLLQCSRYSCTRSLMRPASTCVGTHPVRQGEGLAVKRLSLQHVTSF